MSCRPLKTVAVGLPDERRLAYRDIRIGEAQDLLPREGPGDAAHGQVVPVIHGIFGQVAPGCGYEPDANAKRFTQHMGRVDVHAFVGPGLRVQIGEGLVVSGRPDPDLAPLQDEIQPGCLGLDAG